jgi:hypothetical protein
VTEIPRETPTNGRTAAAAVTAGATKRSETDQLTYAERNAVRSAPLAKKIIAGGQRGVVGVTNQIPAMNQGKGTIIRAL